MNIIGADLVEVSPPFDPSGGTAFVGASIPLLLRRLGQDPALASNIFLTMTTDLVSFGGFLVTASLLL